MVTTYCNYLIKKKREPKEKVNDINYTKSSK